MKALHTDPSIKMNQSEIYRALLKIGGLGILTPADLPELSAQRKAVFLLMLDGGWHSGPEIVNAAGGSEGLRRLRELREIPWLMLDRERSDEKRTFKYRIRVVPSGQNELPL